MKLIGVVLVMFILSGCASRNPPVMPKFPPMPESMSQKCQPLKTIDKPEVKLSELMKTVIENYALYHQCAELVEAWQAWHKIQAEAFEKMQTK